MNINFSLELPKVISAMFPDAVGRYLATEILNKYGTQKEHIAPDRVRLAILKLIENDPSMLQDMVECACGDYRDVLFLAESRRAIEADWDLEKTNPEEFERLVAKDEQEYRSWLQRVLG